jgi:hypothetical protein
MAKSRKKAAARSKARKTAPARGAARKAAKTSGKGSAKRARGAAARRPAAPKAAKKAARKAKKASPKPAAKKTSRKSAAKAAMATRRPPSLDRERRTIREDEGIPSPPSSLNMDRSASSARSGRHEFNERLREHTSTGPALTGGDVDADWEDAEAVGDEAPGGDNPTPDQDIVEEIGEAMGVTYQDNEELKGGEEIIDRDRHRWELDPASREDYDEEE